VAFRAPDGTVGVLDERCPHRKASLALARNEDGGLRCIYHGWKLNPAGEVIEAPNHAGDQAQFCKHVRVNRYHAVDRGGIVWAWLGKGRPRRNSRPAVRRLAGGAALVTSVQVPTNWVQGVEASMDSSHVSVLHESSTQMSAGGGNERVLMNKAIAPKLEFEDRPYGYRYAAVRQVGDGKVYARVNNFVMPWYGIICPPHADGPEHGVLQHAGRRPHPPRLVRALQRQAAARHDQHVGLARRLNFPPLPPAAPTTTGARTAT